jgi:outer membrane protein
MSKSIKRNVFAVVMMIGAAFGTPGAAENLRGAMTSAYNHSGLLDQNRAVLRAADEGVAQALAALRPIVGWSASATRQIGMSTAADNTITRNASTNLSIGLSAELLLYDGGASKMAIDVAKETVLATRQTLIAVEQQVLLSAVQAYMDVRKQTEIVALRKNNLRVIEQELRASQDRFDVGEVTKTDVALAEARLAASRAQLAAAEGALDQARASYKQAIGSNPGALDRPSALPKHPKSLPSAQAIALRNNPDMIKLQHEVKVAELNVARAEAAKGPTISLNGSYGLTDNTSSNVLSRNGQFGVTARGAIATGGQIPSAIRQAKANLAARRSQLHVTRHAIEQSTATAYALLDIAQSSREATQQQIRAAQVAFDGVREEATLGARTTLDVLNAEQELLDAKAQLIAAVADEQVAAYRLKAAMGQLTVDVMNLPVQKYDPTEYYNLVKDAPGEHSKQGQALDRVLKALNK